MPRRRKLWMAVGIGVAVIAIGAGVGLAVARDDDRPLTGEAFDRASQAALTHTGGGTVVETEAGDGGAAYGIEVQLEDGSVVELELDADFRVIGSQADEDVAGETEDNSAGETQDDA